MAVNIHTLEIFNAVLAALFVICAWRKDSWSIVFLLFVYGSLHFLYAAIPMLTWAPIAEIKKVHEDGSGYVAKIASIFVLVTALFLLLIKFFFIIKNEKRLTRLFMVCLAAIIGGYLINIRYGDWMQLRNIASTVFMLVLISMLALDKSEIDWQKNQKKILAALLIAACALGIAFYEVYSHRTWGAFSNSSGEVIHRASSILFNPNLYGLWCAILAISSALLLHQGAGSRRLVVASMLIAFGGIYLSGSRSSAFLLLFALIGVALLMRTNNLRLRWTPVVAMLGVFLAMALGSRWLSGTDIGQPDSWHSLELLGDRFLFYPLQLGSYLLNKLFYFSSLQVPPEVAISIEGRYLEGEGRDSGWLVLFDDAGWLGIVGALVLWSVFIFWGGRTYFKRRDVKSTYSLVALIMTLLIGVVMRFQVFPTGLFIALMLGPCVGYWRGALKDDCANKK